MTSSSPDSVVEADVLAGELFECEDEEEEEEEEQQEEGQEEQGEEEQEGGEFARIKRQEPTPAAGETPTPTPTEDACAHFGVAEPLGSFSRGFHPEGSSCYWHSGESHMEFYFPQTFTKICLGNGQSYFEARSECEESGGRILDLSLQEELDRVTQLGTTLGWTGGWGEAWLWLSAHPDGEGDLADDNSTAWRWDWVERPRNGGHISGARLEGRSGKKVIPNLRSLR